ncbi:MAG: penicillin acylase family protein, partial [Gammaproteobacteria bacterium]
HPWRPITANTTYSSAGLSAPYSRLFQGSTQQASSRPGTSSLVASDALAQLEVDLSKSTFWQSIFRAEHSAAVGSNWWAVSGEHSKTGFPLVANDPHLPTEWPGVFHPVHLRVTKDPQQGHLNAAGASIPGIPAIAHGQNQSVLWSSTTNYLDVSDVFLDQLVSAAAPSANGKACQASSGLCIVSEGVFHDVIITPQTYRVNASSTTRPDRIVAVDAPEPYQNTAHVPFRTFGPVLRVLKPATSHQPGQALVLQYTGFAGTRELQALLGWMRTKTLDEFQASLFYFEVGSQNWLVTDASGHLAYFSSAKSPLRTDLEAGHVEGLGPAFIRPGDGKANWVRQHKPASGDPTRNNLSASLFNTSLDSLSTLPATEMPHIIDPPSGLLINANNDPSGQTLDGHLYNQARLSDNSKIYYLSHDYADGLRAKRITDRLYQHMGITQPLDDHRATLASTLTPKHTKSSQQTLFSAADFRAIQLEQYQQDAQRLLPHLLASHQRRCTDSSAAQTETPFSELCHSAFLKKAISLFAQWNYTTPTGIDWHTAQLSSNAAERQHSLAATYYHLWRAHLIRSMIYTPLEAYALPKPPGRLALRALIRRINTDTFSCTGASGLDFCGDSTSSSSLSDDARRDYALLDALQTVHETLSSPTYAAHLSKTGLNEWVWGTLHRQQFVHALDSNNALTFSIPSNQVLARYAAWQGFPRSGGYETVNAAPIAPDAIMLSDMISHYGPARRVIGHARKNWFRRIMHSESLLPTTRQTTAYPERSIQQWLDNQQAPVLEKETFMRLRWHKIRPGASS